MKLHLAYSPCPNDTFIFDAMVHGKIDTEGIQFEPFLADVETLNRRALAAESDITKLSFHAYSFTSGNYQLLQSGAALGRGCGPILIAREEFQLSEVENCLIAIPGVLTTANFLLSLAFPRVTRKTEMVFSQIEDALIRGEIDAGLIIHENRFTYEKKGLKKIIDLGEWWENNYKLPIPLGGIAVKRSMDQELKERIGRIMRNSVEFALQNPSQAMGYVHKHAQEMEEAVMLMHIGLYVNDFTIDLGETGKEAVEKMFAVAKEKGIINNYRQPIFI
jgi:1,4-dihydroxy-6-naphthoate synthase